MDRNMVDSGNERKKRILLVSHEMTYTGAPRSLLQMAEVLLEIGYDITVWSLQDGNFGQEFKEIGLDVKIVLFPESASDALKEELETFDLVIGNTIFCSAFARYAQRYINTVLYVREAQNIPDLIRDCKLNPSDLRDMKQVVCVSEYARKFIEETYHLESIKVIHNYTDDYRKEISYKQAEKKKIFEFLVSGTVEPRKGQKDVLEAFWKLPKEVRENVRLHIVGAMPEWAKDYWQNMLVGTNEGIIYHGEITDRRALLELYDSVGVIIVASEDESCSLVALEAAMLGKPLLLTDHVGAKYLVDDCYILPAGDSDVLRKKMFELIENSSILARIGEENRRRYMESSTKEIYRKQIGKFVDEILDTDFVQETSMTVSVIVPIYNVERYLKECMDSLISQTLHSMEIICVNDGSTDGSSAILQEYKKKIDSQKYQKEHISIKIISTENCGYGHAMNIGMKSAQGEYIGIVEPDDLVDHKMFEILYHRAIAVDADIVKADFYRFYGDGDAREEIYHQAARAEYNYGRVINPKEEKECFRFIMNTWSGIYRRSFLEKYKICHNETPGASYQDNGFWFQGFCQAERIYFVNIPLYHNRRDNPDSSVNNQKKIYCANEEYAWIRNFLAQNPELEKEFLYQYSMKKYHTYLFTLNRIGWEYKKEYVRRFAKEFLEAERKGELLQSVFTPQEWADLHWIMHAPEEYYEKKVADNHCCEEYEALNEKQSKEFQEELLEKTEINIQREINEKRKRNPARKREDFETEEEYLRYCLEEIQKSKSYKLGRALTWLPRKIRGW